MAVALAHGQLYAKEKPKAKTAGKKEAPAVTTRAPAVAASPPTDSDSKYVDAWASEYRPPAPDLLLSPKDEMKADALAAFVEGQLADAVGSSLKALEWWRKATSFDPSNSDLAVRVAYELARQDDPTTAIQILKDSIAAAPKEPKTRVYLSQIYARHLKKPDLGLESAMKAIALAPNYLPAWVAAHEILLEDQPQKAAELLEKALNNSTDSTEYWLQLGNYMRKFNLKEGGALPPDQIKKIGAIYQKAIELSPHDAAALAQAGDFFILARDAKQALDLYERAVKLNAKTAHPSLDNIQEKLARAYIVQDRRDEAIVILEQIAKDPDTANRPELFELLGGLYEDGENFDKALVAYEQVIALDGGGAQSYLDLANLQIKAGQAKKAIQTMKAARSKFRGQPRVTMMLALTLGAAKEYEESLSMFANAKQEAKPRKDADAILNSAFYYRYGATAEQAGRHELATMLLKTAVTIDPANPDACNHLGYMWAERGENLEEAEKLIRKALAAQPDNGAYLDSLGWVFFKNGKYAEAKKELLRAIEKLPEGDPVIYDHLGDTCEKLGEKEEALKYWKKSLEMDPSNTTIPAKIKALSQ